MSPSRKREAAAKLQEAFAVSERRACKVLSQPRTSQRYQAKPRDDEAKLAARMLELARTRPRFGYRRLHLLLRSRKSHRLFRSPSLGRRRPLPQRASRQ